MSSTIHIFQPLLGRPLSVDSRRPSPVHQAQVSAQLLREMEEASSFKITTSSHTDAVLARIDISTSAGHTESSEDRLHGRSTFVPTSSVSTTQPLMQTQPSQVSGLYAKCDVRSLVEAQSAGMSASGDTDRDFTVSLLQQQIGSFEQEILALKTELTKRRDELSNSKIGADRPFTCAGGPPPRIREILEQLLGHPRTVLLYGAAGDVASSVERGVKEGSNKSTAADTAVPQTEYPVRASSIRNRSDALISRETFAERLQVPHPIKSTSNGLNLMGAATLSTRGGEAGSLAEDNNAFSQSKPIFTGNAIERDLPAQANIPCGRNNHTDSTDAMISHKEVCYRGRGKRLWSPESNDLIAKRTKLSQQTTQIYQLDSPTTKDSQSLLKAFCAVRYENWPLLGSIFGTNVAQKLQMELEFHKSPAQSRHISLTIRHSPSLNSRLGENGTAVHLNWFLDTQVINGSTTVKMIDSMTSLVYRPGRDDNNIPGSLVQELASSNKKDLGKLISIHMRVHSHQLCAAANYFAPDNEEWNGMDDETKETLQELLQGKGSYWIGLWLLSYGGTARGSEESYIQSFEARINDGYKPRKTIATQTDWKDCRL